VYNLEVYQVHNYLVSEVGVLVHNVYGGKGKNKLKTDPDAEGDHTVFRRDDNGDIYKYETYELTKNGYYNPEIRFDGGKPDGTSGAPHVNKKTLDAVPTPHVQGKRVDVRPPTLSETPNNKRFKND
jgi:hypothetical protein